MRLRLRISSKQVASRGQNKGYLFAVVDLDKAESYPQNFVCLLPRLSSTTKSTSTFQRIFGDQSLVVAKMLLTKALRNEDDPNIKAEIQKRLTALKIKPTIKSQCARCGIEFKSKSFGRYQQSICQTCKDKSKRIS